MTPTPNELPEPPLRPKALRAAGLALLALTLSTFAWWPMVWAYPNTQVPDGPQYHKMLEAARVTILRYHELPLWNPFECGGLALWDNPQSFVGAPLAWLTFLVGTTATMQIWYIVHVALGFICMWLFARHELRLSRAATLVASCLWAFNGFHHQHYGGGHSTFVPFLYFPLAILFWRRAEKDDRMAVGLGLLTAWMFYEGAVYPLPHLVVLLGAETLTRAWPPRRVVTIARAGAIAAVVGVLVAGSRLMPVVDQLRTHTRPIGPDADVMQWSTLKLVFLSRAHERAIAGQQYVWGEFGGYVGPILLALAVVGMLAGGLENAWLVALFAFSFLLMLGHQGRWAPWSILNGHVYPFKQMRVPSRFVAECAMFLAMFAGLAIDKVSARAHAFFAARGNLQAPKAVRTALVGLALVGVGDVIGAGIVWVDQCFTQAPEAAVTPSTRLYLGGPGLAGFIDEPRQNRGRVQCWDEWGFSWGAHFWEGDVPQARAADDGAVVEVANRTPNTFTIDVDVKRPSRILVNTSYDHGWQTSVGHVVDSESLLAVDLPPGRHQVKLRYWPRLLSLGIGMTLLGFAGVAAFFYWDYRRRRTRATRPLSDEPAPA